MKRSQCCVYNQTSESFLSLGVTHGDHALTRFKGILGGRAQRYDEGNWVVRPKSVHLFGAFSSRDLVFLDEGQRVVRVIESFPPFRFASVGPDIASVLALPAHTIYWSQTQPGHQLVICVAEEMEFRLRSMPDIQKQDLIDASAGAGNAAARCAQSTPQDRRSARRKRWPRLVAYDSTGGTLAVHGVKDLSPSGLYLMTEERWPLGTHITMTLQRTDGLNDNPMRNAIAVQLRVIRWGNDGVGLAFMQSDLEESPLMALTTR